MFEFTSRNKILIFLFCQIFFGMHSYADTEPDHEALVERYIDSETIAAVSDRGDWQVGEYLGVISKQSELGVIAFVEIAAVTERADQKHELTLHLQRQSRKYLIQTGDFIRRFDVSTNSRDYLGTTDLLIRYTLPFKVSSQYRPLVHQGFVIGDTAQTLFEKEFLINYFGNVYYGYKDWLTLGTLAPANAFGRPNFNFRARVYDSETTTLSTGLSFVKLIKEDQASLNLNFYWDSTSSDALVAHTFVGLGLITWEGAGEAAAIKYLTSNTFQTGYEVILDNWDRFLVGPSYNFETKALGGYLSYIWVMDRLHVQLSVNATDITHLRLDPTDGYYGFFDMFWRF